MQIKCLGGFREVGRNGVLIDGKEKILLDYGMKVETGERPLEAGRVDSILLAHPHLDHSGSVPHLYKQGHPVAYSTISAFDQANLLLHDSMKVARIRGRPEPFSKRDVEKFEKNRVFMTYNQCLETSGGSVIEAMDAGHVPGSLMFIVETGKKRIMYTSDFKLESTRLLRGADITAAKNIDVLIMETTYSSRDHEPRREVEKKLIHAVKETIANGGVAVLPSFAVGRSAELLMVLNELGGKVPIYLDGMAKQATKIILKYPEFLRDPKELRKAVDNVKMVTTDDERMKITKKPCVIVTTGGCLEGGPVVSYIKQLYTRPDCSLIFTGFQIPKTAGRYLMDTGRFVTEGFDLKLKMKTEFLDFSAHAGRTDLLDLVQKISPKKVICMHGEYAERFATEIRGRFEVEAIAPMNGDVIKI